MILRFEQCDLDLVRRTLRCGSEVVSLNAKTFDLLVYLAAHAERVVTKDELLGALWPDSFVEESNLSQHVFLLRKALAGHKIGEGLILTIPGRGYQFTVRVEKVAEEPLAGPRQNMPQHELIFHAVESKTTVVVEEEADDTPAKPGDARASIFRRGTTSRRRTALWVGTLLAVVLATVGGVIYWRKLQPPSPDHVVAVVADLENLTDDSNLDRALQQALQIDLEQSPFLDLLPRARVRETLAEMQQPRDARLTPALAREVCERNNAPVMLHGTISRLGNVYLLMLGAESCVSGKEVAGARAEATSKEQALAALDAAAGHLRKQLGESPDSLERFQTPVAQASTPSLEALRIYSQAEERFSHGDEKTAQTLLEQALALDPGFAYAYSALGSAYYNRGDFTQAAAFYKKAFDLRGRTTERERLSLEINYYAYALNDYEQAIRSLQLFLDIYPQSPNSWSILCNLYTQLGEYPEAIEAGEHALRVDPHSGIGAAVLARAYKRANRFRVAKQTANTAIANGWDSSGPHSILFQIAYAEQDAAAIRTEGEWGLSHQHANLALDDLGFAAATAGRLREAIDDFTRARTESLRNGDTDYADSTLLDLAGVLIQFGETAQASATLKLLHGDGGDPAGLAFDRAETGDLGPAQRLVATIDPGVEKNTLRIYIDLPLLRAELALKAHKPREAIQLLEPAQPYRLRDFTIPYLRARAETEAGLLDLAIQDYQLILDNQGVDPLAPVYSLSHLGLARVLVREKKIDPARAEYRRFFDLWKNADPDLPVLAQARSENAKLESIRSDSSSDSRR